MQDELIMPDPWRLHEQDTINFWIENRWKNRTWDIAMDIGAHWGVWSYYLHRYFSEIHAFEPSELNYRRLLKTREENNLYNLEPIKLGLSNTKAEVILKSYFGADKGSNTILDSHPVFRDTPRETEKVNVITLDEYMEYIGGRVDFIKIDVEGAEIKALQGAEDTIAENVPDFQIELHNTDLCEEVVDILGLPNYIIKWSNPEWDLPPDLQELYGMIKGNHFLWFNPQ